MPAAAREPPMTSETAAPQNPPQIRFTEAAAAKLNEVIAGYPRPVAGLRLQIIGRGPEGLQHVLSIVERGAEPAGDAQATVEGLPVPVFVEGQNLPYLQNVTVNYRYKGPNISGLEFENPSPLIHRKSTRLNSNHVETSYDVF